MDMIYKIENWYNTKDTFTIKENEYINGLIDSCKLDTIDIDDIIMTYIYNKLESLPINYDEQIIWGYTDENISNGLTSNENYTNLLNYLNK